MLLKTFFRQGAVAQVYNPFYSGRPWFEASLGKKF
jgi:hypothetical protein